MPFHEMIQVPGISGAHVFSTPQSFMAELQI